MLLDCVVLDEESENQLSDVLTEVTKPRTVLNAFVLKDAADKLRSTCCTDFEYSAYGFSANIDTDKGGVVLFSVPYDKGFTATINGKPAEIIKADNGLTAVYVGKGESRIEFSYFTYRVKEGAMLSAVGVFLFAVYIVLSVRRKKRCI